jgi:endonuclease YncB( thermonuclease family)
MAYEYKVKEVLRVVDGDTIDVLIDLGFGLTKKERVRVAGIDTPESRTRDPYEKYLGKEASAYLEEQLIEDNIIIKTEKDGKYGRMLGWLYREGEEISIQERMINKGYGWAYDGGTKEKSFAELREKRIADGSWTFPEPEEAGFQGLE